MTTRLALISAVLSLVIASIPLKIELPTATLSTASAIAGHSDGTGK